MSNLLSMNEMLEQKKLEALLRKNEIERKRRKMQESGNNVETSHTKYTKEQYLIDKGHYNTDKPTQHIKFTDNDKRSNNYKGYHGKIVNVKK